MYKLVLNQIIFIAHALLSIREELDMKFYEMLAENYDEIFPLNTKVFETIADVTPAGGKILDVGCATGSMVRKLAGVGFDAVGLEYEPKLIGVPELTVLGDMHAMKFENEQFDTLVCTGNTLVHSSTANSVLMEFARVLKSGGYMVLQILNYDRIMKDRPDSLPTIQTDNVKFERLYHYEDDHIRFQGRLISDGVESSSCVSLYPLETEQLRYFAKLAGMSVEGIYGGFDKSEYDSDNSFPLVAILRKAS
jgi:SAM-dependent methyltransferase